MLFLTFLLIFLQAGYASYIFWLRKAWNSQPEYLPNKASAEKLSILIPARNEEHSIGNLLNDILLQSLPKEQFEVIVIDDASSDSTAEKVSMFKATNPTISLKYLRLEDEQGLNIYKKRAIAAGIALAQNDIIITTDADCRFSEDWLKTVAGYFEQHKPKMLLGAVKFDNKPKLFNTFQQLEFSALVAVTAASAKLGHPLMCNGANLSYRKSAFDQVGGYGNERFASGDDMFLMYKIAKKFRGGVHFLKSQKAMATTAAKQDINEFLSQRKRWVSKNRFLPDWNTLLVGALTYSATVSLIIYFALLFCLPVSFGWQVFFVAFTLKFIADYSFIKSIAAFFSISDKLKFVPLSFFLNLIYVSFILIFSAIGGQYYWKGRKVK